MDRQDRRDGGSEETQTLSPSPLFQFVLWTQWEMKLASRPAKSLLTLLPVSKSTFVCVVLGDKGSQLLLSFPTSHVQLLM